MPEALAVVRRRRNAVFLIFAISGMSLATWLARLPTLRDNLTLDTLQVGVFLFGSSVGAGIGLAISAWVVARYGPRQAILVFSLISLVGMGSVGVLSVVWPWFAIALLAVFLFGVGFSITDVAMNVEGASVERDSDSNIMPWFHASFSLGTVVGAGLASLASAQGIGVEWHFSLIALVLIPSLLFAVRELGPAGDTGADSASESPKTGGELARMWREPRTLAIGLVALGMAFAEGSANDWLPLAMADDRGASDAQAAGWFVLFTGAMMVGRIAGVPLLDRYGRVRVLTGASLAAMLGLTLLISIDHPAVAVLAVILWGTGSSLGFPVAMSAAADDPAQGALRVSVVATVAYAAFLVGPPMIGVLGQMWGVMNSLWVVVALIALASLAIPNVRKITLVQESR